MHNLWVFEGCVEPADDRLSSARSDSSDDSKPRENQMSVIEEESSFSQSDDSYYKSPSERRLRNNS